MKKTTCFAALASFCILGYNGLSQNTLLVYTKYPSQLSFIDAFNKVLPSKAVWNQQDGGYVLNYDDLENTYVSSSTQAASFKLSNSSKLTKLIALQANDKVSLQKCFTSEKYCCEQLNDKQKKGTEKILAVAIMKKSADKNLPLSFETADNLEITDIQELLVAWTAKIPVKEAYIVDVSDLSIVWQQDNYALNKISYQNISPSLKKNFAMNHKYQLGIVLDDNSGKKYTFDFDLKDVAFKTRDYNFATVEVANISWASNKPVSSVSIVDPAGNAVLWEKTSFSGNNLELSKIDELKNKVVPGKEFKLQVELDDKSTYDYSFQILLSKEDSDALRSIIE